jgi:anhydro-N-acetylmuramic acid kinase
VSDELFIGMRAGASGGAADAVLVNFNRGSMDILHAMRTPYPPAIRQTLGQLLKTGARPDSDLAALLDDNLGKFFARVAQNLVREAGLEVCDIKAIGSHGQTVRYARDGETPQTAQLGNPALIARGTATTVVADFRSADIKNGGRGAPLAPLLHRHLFYCDTENRAVVNLGAIAGLTLLQAGGGILAVECGPGNCLMDGWTQRHLHKDYDTSGNWASKGVANAGLLQRLLDDDYFSSPVPANTGRDYFNMDWLDKHLSGLSLPPGTVQTTLVELTAMSIANSLQGDAPPDRLLVCGGGLHNAYLMRRIAAALPDTTVEATTRHGADPGWVEGLLFAWLARQRLAQETQDTRSITGARQAVLLGEIFEPPAQ